MATLNLNAAVNAAKAVREAVEQLNAKCSELDAERAKLKARNQELLSLPVSRDDAKQFILDTIDRVGAEFPDLAGWRKAFLDFAYPKGGGRKEKRDAALSLRDIEQMSGGGQDALCSVLGNDHGSFFYGSVSLIEMAPARIYFFFGDAIKKKVDEHFDELFPEFRSQSVDAGTSIAERRAEIEVNDSRISAIGSEIRVIEQQLATLS